MAGVLSTYPFVLPLLAAAIAELSAILLRRTAATLGRWLFWVAGLLSSVAAGSLIWSYTWAMSITPVTPWGSALTRALGGIVILAGGALLLWSFATLGVESLLANEKSRLVSHGPYRFIRRPMGAAIALLGIGGALTSGSPVMWIWLIGWLILSLPLSELEDWELRTRVEGAEAYLRRTPRYLPRRR